MTTPTFASYTATLYTLADIWAIARRLLGQIDEAREAYSRALWLASASQLDGPWRDLARSVATGSHRVRR